MTKDEKVIIEIDKLLDKLDNKTKNTLIRLLMTHDKKDIWIQQIPIYEDWEWQGHIMARYIKDCKYYIGVKNETAAYVDVLKGDEPHIINLN